eukprot:CFRG5191T1
MSSSELCGVCNQSLSKYKCPKCEIRYCSIPCFKKHKETPCVSDSVISDTSNTTTSTTERVDDNASSVPPTETLNALPSALPSTITSTSAATTVSALAPSAKCHSDEDASLGTSTSDPNKTMFNISEDDVVPKEALDKLGHNAQIRDLLRENVDLRDLLEQINADSRTQDISYVNGLLEEAMLNPKFQQFAHLCLTSIQEK